MKVFNAFSNTMVDSNTMMAANKLIELKNTKGQWEVIDEVLNVWHKTNPKKWKAHLIELKDLKETRQNKFASTRDKSLRFLLDIPEKVILMIRKLYTTEECPMDKKWMLKFAKRYPKFLVADRV